VCACLERECDSYRERDVRKGRRKKSAGWEVCLCVCVCVCVCVCLERESATVLYYVYVSDVCVYIYMCIYIYIYMYIYLCGVGARRVTSHLRNNKRYNDVMKQANLTHVPYRSVRM